VRQEGRWGKEKYSRTIMISPEPLRVHDGSTSLSLLDLKTISSDTTTTSVFQRLLVTALSY